MKVFIDFDDVIFNTRQFKKDLANIFFAHGISNYEYEESYYDPNDKRTVKTYDPRSQITRLEKIKKIDKNKLLHDIDVFMKDIEQYIFPDFVSFVNRCGQENLYVVSYGDIKFQEEKIKKSGILKILKNIVITDNLKAKVISEIINTKNFSQTEKTFFLDDRTEQIHNVKEKFPKIITILVKRPEGRYQEMLKEQCCDWEVHSLEEAQKIIFKS